MIDIPPPFLFFTLSCVLSWFRGRHFESQGGNAACRWSAAGEAPIMNSMGAQAISRRLAGCCRLSQTQRGASAWPSTFS